MAVRMGGMDKLPVGREAVEDSILEVRVDLVDSEPGIWRQLELRSSMTLDQVHQVLQTAFGWENAHLHRFMTDDPFAPLGPVDGELHDVPQWLPEQHCEEPAERPEEESSLDQLLALGGGKAFYEYDFGDSWLHRLQLVSRLSAGPSSPAARLVAGARRGPLEDSGGMPGYEDFMDALADKSHPDHAEHVAWVAELTGLDAPFDPAFLDIDAVNHALSGRR